MSREVHVPFYERLGVQFPRPTHRFCSGFPDIEALLAERGQSPSPTRRSDDGVGPSARAMGGRSGADAAGWATRGIWTSCALTSRADARLVIRPLCHSPPRFDDAVGAVTPAVVMLRPEAVGKRTLEERAGHIGVLFADISDSSYLYRAHGDTRARDIVLDCMDVLRSAAHASQGSVVERIGDELMCTFATPDTTVRGGIDLQDAVADARALGALPGTLGVRIGLHYGPVLADADSLFGETLYTANRVCGLARGHQILTTGETVEALAHDTRALCRFVERTTLKGKNRAHDVYQVMWSDPHRTEYESQVGIAGHDVGNAGHDVELQLRRGEWIMILDDTRPVCTVGRSPHCDLVIDAGEVSRVHARIERRQGYFVLVDVSSNGTLVDREGGGRVRIRRDEIRLAGSGTIAVGPNEAVALDYTCRPKA